MAGSGFMVHARRTMAAYFLAALVSMGTQQCASGCKCAGPTPDLCELVGDESKILLNVEITSFADYNSMPIRYGNYLYTASVNDDYNEAGFEAGSTIEFASFCVSYAPVGESHLFYLRTSDNAPFLWVAEEPCLFVKGMDYLTADELDALEQGTCDLDSGGSGDDDDDSGDDWLSDDQDLRGGGNNDRGWFPPVTWDDDGYTGDDDN